MRINDYPHLSKVMDESDELSSIELEFKEFLESLNLVDNVILDFSETMRGDSEIIVSFDNLKSVTSSLNHDSHLYVMGGTVYGLWKVDYKSSVGDVLDERNKAYYKLMRVLTDASLGLFHVNVTGGVRNTYLAKTDDIRFFFGFELSVELKFAVK